MSKLKEQEEFQEGEVVEEIWSKRRIFIGIAVVVAVLGLGSYFFKSSFQDALPQKATLGTQDVIPTPEVEIPNKEELNEILNNAKESLSEITSENVTSSESAIQKIIQDLERVQGGDGTAKNVLCEYVCKDNR